MHKSPADCYKMSNLVSDELAAGIRRYANRIAALGGYGTHVRATMPDGAVREGALIELGHGGCQPGIRQDDGRRFAADIDRVSPVL